MSWFYSALGVVLGSLYYALSGHGVLVSALICLIISSLAFTTFKKYYIQIFSLLSFFLLMFLSFNLRQEYFQYFANDKVQSEGQIFRVIDTKESSFFSERVLLKPTAKNFYDDYTNPTFIWKTKNFKALIRNDLISFPGKIEIKELDPKKTNYYRKDKVFSTIANKDFVIEGKKRTPIDRLQSRIKRFYREHLKPGNAELALGLILGNRNSNIEQSTINSIRNLGLGHFFSASGFHLIILLMIIFWISSKSSLIKRFQNPIAISFILLYMALINFSPSITRAGLMAIAYILFQNTNRKLSRFKLLIVLAAIVLIIDPYTVFDIGFQFSYLATLGIITWYDSLESKLESLIKVKWLREIAAVTLSTQILIFPLVIYYFSNLQIWSLIANIVFTPILSLITVLSFTGIYFLLDPILSLLNYLFNLSQSLPFITTNIDLDLTSLILAWVFLITAAFYILKDTSKEENENIIVSILKSREVQLSLCASAFLLMLATNLEPYNVYQLKIKNGVIANKEYSHEFKTKDNYKYFEIQGRKALLINKLPSIEIIKDDIQEVNFLFIPNLTDHFIYMDKLVETLKPQVSFISTKKDTTKVKENLELIATKSNILYGDGRVFLSHNKFWKLTNNNYL